MPRVARNNAALAQARPSMALTNPALSCRRRTHRSARTPLSAAAMGRPSTEIDSQVASATPAIQPPRAASRDIAANSAPSASTICQP
jgi:hypothetical protein